MSDKDLFSEASQIASAGITRRRFLTIVGVGSASFGGLAVLAACGGGKAKTAAVQGSSSSTGNGSAASVAAPSVAAPVVAAPSVAAPTAAGASANPAGQTVTAYIFRGEEGVKGPDGKGHDAFVPSSFVVVAGQPVTVNVINSDEGKHSITSKELNLDQEIAAGKQLANDEIEPVTTTFTFTAAKEGVYRWDCELTCDGGGGNWAMSNAFDGAGEPGFMAGYIVAVSPDAAKAVNPSADAINMFVFRGEEGVKGPDGKGHDAMVPASFVVKAGKPVTVNVINSDEGKHSITSKELELDQEIAAGKQLANDEIEPVATTFTFTAPNKGVYRWDCELTCDGGGGNWAMSNAYDGPSQPGFMAGNIVAI
jgi:plastocyanin